MTTQLSCFLYCSQLAEDADISCIPDIIKTARAFNKQHLITGMLIFDGQRFCQYIEGPEATITELATRIAQDPRHTNFQPKHDAPLSGDRLFAHWSMAYVLVDDAEPLNDIETVKGPTALEKLQSLMPMLDVT
ncbi:MAG: BLUF domain-containing protein [Comamonas sp.]